MNNTQKNVFFSFANTITTTQYNEDEKPRHGWMGVRFQLNPNETPNDVILDIRLHENDARLQQETVGVLGVNLMYASFYYHNSPEKFIKSLYDNLSRKQVEIDMVQMNGLKFDKVDLYNFFMQEFDRTFGSRNRALHNTRF